MQWNFELFLEKFKNHRKKNCFERYDNTLSEAKVWFSLWFSSKDVIKWKNVFSKAPGKNSHKSLYEEYPLS